MIPSSWPPAIQACIDQDSDEARKRELIPTIRSEICRVLSNAMFCYDPNPNKDLCTRVAKLLVKKYKFMADVGRGVTGYVSHVCIWLHVSESRLSLCRDDTIFRIVHPIPTFPFIQLNDFCPCILSSPLFHHYFCI